MPTFDVTLGPASQGRCKETNKRHFAKRLSSGKRLQVIGDEPITVTVNDVDARTLQNLASRDYIALQEVAEKRAATVERTSPPINVGNRR